jgi:hypothetical protein
MNSDNEKKLRNAVIEEYAACADLEHSIVEGIKTKVNWTYSNSPYGITVASVLFPINTCIRRGFYLILSDLMLNIDCEK